MTTTPSARPSPPSRSGTCSRAWSADGEPLEVRIGIATGEVVTTARDGTGGDDLALTGSAITTAARIQSIARRGEILLDTATLEAARGRLRVADRGSVVLRGQSEPVGIHLLEAGPSFGGPGTFRMPVTGPLVGRDRRGRAGSARSLERCATTGRGGAILVVGEAGIGKTRLLAEIEDEARARGLAWTWAENTSYGQAEPYRFARVFAQAVADEHAVDSGTFARTMLFTPDLAPDVGSRFGGAIAAIARDAAFSGWEAEAPDMPADQAAVTATLLEVAGRYIDRIIETAGPRVDRHRRPALDGSLERRDGRGPRRAGRAVADRGAGRDAARAAAGVGVVARASSGWTSAASRCPRRRSSRPRSRGRRSTPTTPGGSTTGPRAIRCSSPRPSARSSRTGPSPGTAAASPSPTCR